ncbi:MAG: diguanylate cyclase [Spirochaetia bacterium]
MAKTPVDVLGSIDILSNLSADDLNRLYSLMRIEEYREGTTLFKEGDTGEIMYIVLSGSVSISVRTQDGGVLELAEISEGSFFGEMSIFDSTERSATCTPKSDTKVLSLRADNFYEFIKTKPEAGISIMRGMLKTTAQRLATTGAFLSDMVTWGEKARARAITDDFTGLYNRRFLDQAAEERLTEAHRKGSPLSLMMLDLDHFGTINDEYGQAIGDRVVLAAVEAFRKSFSSDTVSVRYGGDEFTFLLKETSPEQALENYNKLIQELGKIELPVQSDASVKNVTASVGIAAFPDSGDSFALLMKQADKALYQAKEQGRGRAVVWSENGHKVRRKSGLYNLKEKNRIITRIIQAIAERDNFLMLGHRNPDEDCIASMIAMGLLINKFSKNVYLMIPRRVNENYQYLLHISRYNEIGVIYNDEVLPRDISTVFLMDTPKPAMQEPFPGSAELLSRRDVLKIEIDHHLEADSSYAGDPGYCLVDEASSACELVGLLAFKLAKKSSIIEAFSIQEIFSRNFVLSVLTGIIGDSKMGKYLKTRRERWFYNLFSGLFNEMLSSKTRRESRNFSSMDQVFTELQRLTREEEACFSSMMDSQAFFSNKVASVIIERDAMSSIESRFDHDTIVSVARYLADVLAESSKMLSLVVYPDRKAGEGLIQFRVRRSEVYKELDLRNILSTFSIENGGGHPGAIGFRIPEKDIPNISHYSLELIRGIEQLLDK